MGTGPSKIPSDTPLGCLVANLEPLWLLPDLKAKTLVFLCNQVWPQYQLDNNSKWPLDGTLNPNILGDLYNFYELTGRLQEIPYFLAFSFLRSKPSLHRLLPCPSPSGYKNPNYTP
jgi:hypothetical protein